MKLINLKLRNFKGCHSFTLELDGNDMSIFGDNGTFKTTLFDAFAWLLFDKDSANRKDFEIKTLGVDGEPIHGLEHEVEGLLEVNGKQLSLKKVYSENWTKKRGSVEREFTGHTTNYFIDGVPTKKNEYEARIASIVDEDAFKLLANPRHFNEVLHWQDRRRILLEVCGDLSDADVIASDSKLAKLPEILNGRKLEDHRKIIAARRAAINKDIEMIPVRISEGQRGLPDAADATNLDAGLADLRQQRNVKAEELANLEAGGGVAEKTKELRLIEAEIIKGEREQWTKSADKIQAAKVELRRLEDEGANIGSAMAMRQGQIDDKQASITQYSVKLEALRQEWSTTNSLDCNFTPSDMSDTCPACGQSLPAEQLEAASLKAIADFNEKKANNLAAITEEGHSIKARVDALTEEVGKLEVENTNNEGRLVELYKEIGEAVATITALEDKETPADPAYLVKLRKAEAEVENLKASNTGAVEAMSFIISTIDAKIAEGESAIAQIKQREAGMERIEELKSEERTLAEEFERLEGELYLTEQFVKTKVSLLEGRINSRFHMARFKLFNQLVNGGVEEVCETIYLGVPYSSALNNSARINIGLDIINTLSEHFQFVAPIWIDNAEAVTQLVATKGQQIKLYVSEADKVLRIEAANGL